MSAITCSSGRGLPSRCHGTHYIRKREKREWTFERLVELFADVEFLKQKTGPSVRRICETVLRRKDYFVEKKTPPRFSSQPSALNQHCALSAGTILFMRHGSRPLLGRSVLRRPMLSFGNRR